MQCQKLLRILSSKCLQGLLICKVLNSNSSLKDAIINFMSLGHDNALAFSITHFSNRSSKIPVTNRMMQNLDPANSIVYYTMFYDWVHSKTIAYALEEHCY